MTTPPLPANGGERFNRLIFARSPYLLQYAENPVDWYEWGPAAFDRARSESLPILLSIGYATCHWCHVMAHESFEDVEVAALLNRHFVCIKVDREERPDIDDFYMAVSQTLTGSGGWPLNIFMTPDKRPFMAITYFPKRGRSGMSGLMELLGNIATLWRQRPDMIEKNCQGIMEALESSRKHQMTESSPDIACITEKSLQHLKSIYDAKHGGFGSAPKFPMPMYVSWLIGQGGDSLHIATFSGKTDTAEAFVLNTALHNHSIKNLIVRCEQGPSPLSLSLCFSGACYPAVSTVDELDSLFQQTGTKPRHPFVEM